MWRLEGWSPATCRWTSGTRSRTRASARRSPGSPFRSKLAPTKSTSELGARAAERTEPARRDPGEGEPALGRRVPRHRGHRVVVDVLPAGCSPSGDERRSVTGFRHRRDELVRVHADPGADVRDLLAHEADPHGPAGVRRPPTAARSPWRAPRARARLMSPRPRTA